MRAPKHIIGIGVTAFGAGLLLASILPCFALVCIIAAALVASGLFLIKK